MTKDKVPLNRKGVSRTPDPAPVPRIDNGLLARLASLPYADAMKLLHPSGNGPKSPVAPPVAEQKTAGKPPAQGQSFGRKVLNSFESFGTAGENMLDSMIDGTKVVGKGLAAGAFKAVEGPTRLFGDVVEGADMIAHQAGLHSSLLDGAASLTGRTADTLENTAESLAGGALNDLQLSMDHGAAMGGNLRHTALGEAPEAANLRPLSATQQKDAGHGMMKVVDVFNIFQDVKALGGAKSLLDAGEDAIPLLGDKYDSLKESKAAKSRKTSEANPKVPVQKRTKVPRR